MVNVVSDVKTISFVFKTTSFVFNVHLRYERIRIIFYSYLTILHLAEEALKAETRVRGYTINILL